MEKHRPYTHKYHSGPRPLAMKRTKKKISFKFTFCFWKLDGKRAHEPSWSLLPMYEYICNTTGDANTLPALEL